jgi:endonuclease/exonuclease/phosphatase family metal-dependent hydrolase
LKILRKIFSKTIVVGFIIIFVLGLLTVISGFISLEYISIAPAIQTGFLIYFVFSAFFLVYFSIRFQKVYFYLALFLFVILLYPFSFWFNVTIPNFVSNKSPSFSVSVCTYNINNKLSSVNEDSLEDWLLNIKEINADIIALQDFTVTEESKVPTINKLKNLGYKYYVDYYFNKTKILSTGLAIFSKFPITKHKRVKFKHPTDNGSFYTELEIGGKKINIFNVHLQSNRLSRRERNIETLPYEKKTKLHVVFQVINKIISYATTREKQVKELIDKTKDLKDPVIILGDFNEVPYTYAQKLMRKNFTNAFQKKGYGFGHSYQTFFKVLKIDYIFLSQNIKVLECKRYIRDGSDHYPIYAKISL